MKFVLALDTNAQLVRNTVALFTNKLENKFLQSYPKKNRCRIIHVLERVYLIKQWCFQLF